MDTTTTIHNMAASSSKAFQRLSIKTFALLRIAVGAGSLLIPNQAAKIFGVDSSRILSRLFGARELALGTLLWYALAKSAPSAITASDSIYQRDLKRMLWIGIVIDSVDVISSAACVAEGNLGGKAIWLVGVGAAGFAGLGSVGLWASR